MTPEPGDELLYEVADGVGRVTFNRPGARNALTFGMYERLAALCEAAGQDSSLRALILTGAGEKAFAAGTDISQFRGFASGEDAIAYEQRIDRILSALESCPVPTIAAISGACTGGGAAIAACCDIRLGSATARFGFPIARTLGNMLSVKSLARLADLLGPALVKEILFTARLIEAEEAKAAGWLSEILPDHAALLARADGLARLLAGHAPLTLRATKEGLRRVRDLGSGADDRDLVLSCYGSADFREGMEAFVGKREPRWTGQ